MVYRRRATPLHAARAVAGSAWCVAVATAALVTPHPLAAAALLAGVLAAAAAARVAGQVVRATLWSLPFALAFALVNPLVSREGLTVIARFGDVPPFGPLDITLEATVFGLVFGLKAVVLIAAFALHSAAVDPDGLLRAFRRISLRSALTAALATRVVPVLAQDARRLAEAQRCRPGEPASRLAIVRAVSANAMDRALDVAATLEVRGYGGAARPPRDRRPWSRHDIGFAASAAAVLAVAVAGRAAGWSAFTAFPAIEAAPAGRAAAVSALLAAVLLAPFAGRRGV